MTSNQIMFYVNLQKAQDYAQAHGCIVSPAKPAIKNTGLFADAGIDLFAAYAFSVLPNQYVVVDSFVSVLMPIGVAGMLWPRGGDVFLVGSGIIDTGYTGTIKVKIINPFPETLSFEIGDSIGQLVLFVKGVVSSPELVEVSGDALNNAELSGATRGQDGRINKQ